MSQVEETCGRFQVVLSLSLRENKSSKQETVTFLVKYSQNLLLHLTSGDWCYVLMASSPWDGKTLLSGTCVIPSICNQ